MNKVGKFSGLRFRSRAVGIAILGGLLLLVSHRASSQLHADFSTNLISVCSGSNVTFTDNTVNVTGTATYLWNFGNGASPATGTGPGPHTVTYSVQGYATVSLTVTDEAGTDAETKNDYIAVFGNSTDPAGVSITNNDTCNGTDKVLIVIGGSLGTGAVWEWFTGSCGGTPAGTGPSITVDPAAGTSTTYYVRASGICNTTTCASGTVVVLPSVGTPITPVPSASTICQGTTSTAFSTSATNATSYLWSVTGDGNTISGTGTTGTVTWSPTFAGVATVSVQALGCNGPSVTASTTVTVRPTPTAIISGTAAVCQGAAAPNIIFTNPMALPVTITYDINNGADLNINVNANGTAALTIPTSTVGTFAYNLVSVSYQTVPLCQNAVTGTATVTVNPLPVVNAGVDVSISNGTSTTLAGIVTGTGPFTYSWAPSNLVNNSSEISTTTVNLASTQTFTLTATSQAGCAASDQVTVTVTGSALGSSASATPSSVCAGTSVQLAANATGGSGTYSYSWTSSPGTFTSNSATPTVTPTVTTVYTVAVNDGFSSTSSNVTVTVNPLPVVDAGVNQTIPFGTSTTLNATVTGTGLTYIWIPSASLLNPSVVDPTTVNLNATTLFTLTATTSSNCSASDQVTVTVTGSALGSAASATPSTGCAGTSVQLAANATGGSGTYAYSWTSSPGTFTSNSATPVVNPAVATVYTVVVNDGFNSTSSNVTVTVDPLPITSAITGNATPACSGTGYIYSVNATAGSSYVWTVPTGSTILSGAGTNSITVNFGTTNGNITVTETNSAGCAGSARMLFISLLGCGLDADFTANPTTVCAGLPVQFANTSLGTTGSTLFLWNFGSGANPATANTAGPHIVTYSTGGLKTVTLTITEGATNTETKTDYITVNPLPVAAGTITGTATVCQGQSGVAYTVPEIANAASYNWVYSGTGATIIGTTRSVTIVFLSGATSGTLTVRGVNPCGNGPISPGYFITVNPLPPAPTVNTITQPTCSVATGSVVLGGLPSGNWTINPGNIAGSTTTVNVTGLAEGSHTFTVTNANGCTSPASAAVVINKQPAIPTPPVMGTVTQPTCAVTTGSVGISGLPSTGNWTLTRNPGGAESTGFGPTFTATGIPAGTYTYTVTNDAGCVSPASASFTVNAPLPVPAVPVLTVDCSGGFNHAVITVTSPTGTGYEYRLDTGAWQQGNVFLNIANGTHTVTVRNSSGCITTGPEFSINCGCITPPLLTLGAASGSTCGLEALTVTGNTFGGSATSVIISDNGGGTVSPSSSTTSPFSFTYTPTAADAGRTVVITVTTNNPLGSPCAAASANYTLTVNALPVAPVPGTVTHPTCALPTGSVMLNSLPASGDWIITRTPGGQTTTGSGTSTTVAGLAPGTYTFTVTNGLGCVSGSSLSVTINTQPDTPAAPVAGTVTQPTCALSTGTVELSGLPDVGTWTLTRLPSNVPISGTGTTRTVSAIPPGTYTFTVANAAGCVSPASAQVVINAQPVTPPAPFIGTITHPTCDLATGSILLENMPETGEWTLIRYPGGTISTGTGSSTTISSLPAGTYNFTVRNADMCTSAVSYNADINAQPPTPQAPVVGTITHPTFLIGTGSVVLSGLPSTGTWTLLRYPDSFTSQGTGTTRTVSGLEPGTYTFAVTNSFGCTSALTGDVVINAIPGAPVVVINNPPTICENETTDLTAPAVTAGSDVNLTFTYWTDAVTTITYETPQAAPAGTYYIMGTSTAGYYTTKPVIVTADQVPVSYAGEDQSLDYLFGTKLEAENPAIGTGIWALVSGSGALFDTTAYSTTVSGLSVGENVFRWTVTNGACDPVTDLVMVRVNDLMIPTLITPNGDFLNETFEIHGLDETLGDTELIIFDRRGLKVWESRDYQNDWDGRDYNSNPLPEDTYFFVLRAANGVSRSGYIVVRR